MNRKNLSFLYIWTQLNCSGVFLEQRSSRLSIVFVQRKERILYLVKSQPERHFAGFGMHAGRKSAMLVKLNRSSVDLCSSFQKPCKTGTPDKKLLMTYQLESDLDLLHMCRIRTAHTCCWRQLKNKRQQFEALMRNHGDNVSRG